MRYLTAEEILILHACIVDETGGSHGVRDVVLLASIAHKPQTTFGGKDMYPGIFKKAAVLFEAIANYHVFIDGNKRTALIMSARFLHMNGHEFVATNAEAERITLAVAKKELSIAELAALLKKHSKKVPKKKR